VSQSRLTGTVICSRPHSTRPRPRSRRSSSVPTPGHGSTSSAT